MASGRCRTRSGEALVKKFQIRHFVEHCPAPACGLTRTYSPAAKPNQYSSASHEGSLSLRPRALSLRQDVMNGRSPQPSFRFSTSYQLLRAARTSAIAKIDRLPVPIRSLAFPNSGHWFCKWPFITVVKEANVVDEQLIKRAPGYIGSRIEVLTFVGDTSTQTAVHAPTSKSVGVSQVECQKTCEELTVASSYYGTGNKKTDRGSRCGSPLSEGLIPTLL